MFRVALTVFAVSVAAAGAQAVGLNGEAMVNRGDGYKPQVAGSLKAGDTVMVRQGTTATISFEDGCAFTLSAGRVFVVSERSPCADGTQTARTVDFSGRMGQSGQNNDDDKAAGAWFPPGGPGVGALVVGAAVAVGAGVLIYQATKKDSSP